MKRKYLVTLTFEAYGDSPEEAIDNGKYVVEDIAERLSITGEQGSSTSVKLISVADTATPWTEEELVEIADMAKPRDKWGRFLPESEPLATPEEQTGFIHGLVRNTSTK